MKEIFPPESWYEAKEKRNEYFVMLRRLKNQYVVDKSNNYNSKDGFTQYVEDLIGIRIKLDGGMITDQYTIVDKEKYFLYKLKQ